MFFEALMDAGVVSVEHRTRLDAVRLQCAGGSVRATIRIQCLILNVKKCF